MTRSIPVALAGRSYEVVIGRGLFETAGARLRALGFQRRAAIVTDETVAAHWLAPLEHAIAAAGLRADVVTLPPGEHTKSFKYLEFLLERLIELELDRKDVLVALGGGVIGDLTGLAAGLLKRGVDYIQVPTTLLAMVDSSVGGKTAIDSRKGKNLIGLFHQPRLVLGDLDALETLPLRQRRAGYAEIVKIGLIRDPALFAWLGANAANVIERRPEPLLHAVATAVAAKAEIVAADEREAGERALLNLGHTFGHALEAASGFDPDLLHGEAVAAGMGLAFALSAAMGLCPEADAEAVRAHLFDQGFEMRINRLPGRPFDVNTLLGYMANDKKAEAGQLTFILAQGIGRGIVARDVPRETVSAVLKEALARS